MISTDRRVSAFVAFSEFLRSPESAGILDEWAQRAYLANNWFVPGNVRFALRAISEMLADRATIAAWYGRYKPVSAVSKIGVVLAGNIPAVGFHDIMCVLISGHKLMVKPSKDDHVLTRLILDKLCEIESAFSDYIEYVERINTADAYIATGSDNTARYFEYYFAAKPHIIRKNRVSVAVLSGEESREELDRLSTDIFYYYGLGCRNLSKLYVPKGYDFSFLYQSIEQFRAYAAHHHRYFNNYEYNRSILLVNGDKHLDNGFFLIRQHDQGLVSPLSMVYYKEYEQLEEIRSELTAVREKIQCVVSSVDLRMGEIAPGRSQFPGLYDYADGEDVMAFLSDLGSASGR